ncbi:RNA polymerase sigma factor 54 [Syntrophomonas zehnderi OL-4]|uniref:RNA polymerase sigma factor 54 n=1 Tax=Syntrophomonas zehnderi OL-4 TaxID=690567 RepID=A0A0E4GU05_9FIRM|nr:RNA polymerase factor sigma-54 [Syntrophomonas zehnderi]CQB51976.1 RNA polymerase sigma factor 54 [Syntrophomonas zehnderi OL-4]
MKLTHDIYLEQQQKLLMTPELRQAIAMLQMSTLELGEYIQKELEENPFLEEREEGSLEGETTTKETNEIEENKTEDWLESYYERDNDLSVSDREDKSFDNYISKTPSLYEHLQFQLRMLVTGDLNLEIGNYIIGNIDANGYLTVDLEEVAGATGTDIDQVQAVLQTIQAFHPHGVGARDLAECLLIQLEHNGKEDPVAIAIIEEHLQDLARGRLNKIAQDLDISVQEAQEVCDFIRTLDPKPGLQYSSGDEIKYIVADIIVEKVDGEYIVLVNDSNYPRLIISRMYENMLRRPESLSPEVRKYLEDKMNSAVWLIKSIEQRRMTLYKVARCIVDIQKDFLDNGIKYIKPLNLKQVADIIEVHESTVSRATSNKYIQTPQGLFELKFFFSSGVSSYANSNEKVSSKSIKKQIQEIIEKEDNSNPWSDQQLVEMLKENGIRISRRTVAKYRQELGIPSTVTRKRY